MPPAVQFSIWTRQLKAYPRRLIFYLGQETLYDKSLEINHGNIDTIYPHWNTSSPEILRVREERVSDNQPQANIIPTALLYQKIRNMKSNPSNSRYALETCVIAAIDILSHYDGNAVTNLITGSAE